MKKDKLTNELRSVGISYLLFFTFGCHYLYLNKIGTQFLYWFTFGGLGIWSLVDLFSMQAKVDSFNEPIFEKLEILEKEEKAAAGAIPATPTMKNTEVT